MSEYQYYEFLALDRPLGAKEQAELRGISSRATISSTRFANSYSFGNLKANPADLVDRYLLALTMFHHGRVTNSHRPEPTPRSEGLPLCGPALGLHPRPRCSCPACARSGAAGTGASRACRSLPPRSSEGRSTRPARRCRWI